MVAFGLSAFGGKSAGLKNLLRPFDLIPKYTGKCERTTRWSDLSALVRLRPTKAEQQNASEFSKCLNWSQLLNEARTFFEQNPD